MLLLNVIKSSLPASKRYTISCEGTRSIRKPAPGWPGRPSHPITDERAGKVLPLATGYTSAYVKVVKVKVHYGATHAASKTGQFGWEQVNS